MPIAHDLERIRLEQRARRIELVILELRARASYRAARGGEVPAPLREAIDGLREELTSVDRRLAGRSGRYSTRSR